MAYIIAVNLNNFKMKIIAFGEIMLRLSPVGCYNCFVQTEGFDAGYGGGEANVAVGLAMPSSIMISCTS